MSQERRNTMKKKVKKPKNFGSGIGSVLCAISDDDIYNFVVDFSKELAKKDDVVQDTKQYLCKKYHMEESVINEIMNHFISALLNIMLPIGFTLGQTFDIKKPEAIQEMNYIVDKMKKKNLLLIYPKERKAA
jgi:hypothetical protein